MPAKDRPNAARYRAIVRAIVRILDGQTWSPDTLDQIAAVLRAEGYDIRDHPVASCVVCGSTAGPTIPPGSADAYCEACGADWLSEDHQ